MATIAKKSLHILVACAFDAGENKAFAINTIKIANSFVELGHRVSIVCYNGVDRQYRGDELADMYQVSPTIRWVQLPRIRQGRYAMDVHRPFATLALLATFFLRPDIVYSRNYVYPAWTARAGIPTIVESHAHVDYVSEPFMTMIHASAYSQMRKLVTIAPALKSYYVRCGFDEDKIEILPTGVNIDDFSPPVQLASSPYKNEGYNVVYVGHLYDYKGIPTILESAELLPQINFHLVGGLEEDILRHQTTIEARNLNNVTLHGFHLQKDIPPYLWHADLLLLPPSANHPSAEWTSPVKLGEYLASGTQIIATDIPALRNWISESEVDFCIPDDAKSLTQAIETGLQNIDSKAENRLELAKSLSNENRATAILKNILSSDSVVRKNL